MSAPTALKPDALLSKPLPAANPVSWQWGRAAEEACRLEELFERFGREGAVGMSMGRPRATITRLPRAIWRAFLPAFPIRYVQGKPLTEVAMASAVVLPAHRREGLDRHESVFSYRRKFGRLNWKLQLTNNNIFGVKEEEGSHSYGVRSTEPRPYVTTATVEF